MSPRTNLDSSCEVNGPLSIPSDKTKVNRKRESTESFSSDSSSADSNQNKMRRRTEKCRNYNKSKDTNGQKINLSNGGEDPEKVQNAIYGQSDEAAFQFMVRTEKGWSCKECEFMSAAKSENNSRQNLRRHVLAKHCRQEDVFCQYCNKEFRNLPSCEKHISGCFKRYSS